MDELTEEAKQVARASRGTEWYLDEKLSTGEITLQQKDPSDDTSLHPCSHVDLHHETRCNGAYGI